MYDYWVRQITQNNWNKITIFLKNEPSKRAADYINKKKDPEWTSNTTWGVYSLRQQLQSEATLTTSQKQTTKPTLPIYQRSKLFLQKLQRQNYYELHRNCNAPNTKLIYSTDAPRIGASSWVVAPRGAGALFM